MNVQPTPGFWYRDVAADETFTVVFVDAENDLIEVEYTAGDVVHLTFEVWGEMNLELAERP